MVFLPASPPPCDSGLVNEARPLGPVTLLALGVNGIVGVGIFVAPPIVARAFPGAAGALAYLAIAIACLPIAIVYATLSRALPHDGGPTLFAERAFGARVATAIGALVAVSAVFSTAAVTHALSERVAASGLGRAAPIAIVLSSLLALVNLRGLRLSAWVWTALTVAKLVPLVVLAALGAFAAPAQAVTHESGAKGPALLAILFALQGFEIVPLPAGQTRDPARTVPRATVAALVMAGALYAAVHLACVRALPSLAGEASPIAAAAEAVGGAALSRALGFGVVASMAGIVVGMHAMTPRYLAAVTVRGRGAAAAEPRRPIAITAVVVSVLCLTSDLSQLLDLASVAVLGQYALTACALLALAARRKEGLVPRDAWPVPLVLVVAVVLVVQAPVRDLVVAAVVALAAALVSDRLGRLGSGARGPTG